MRDAYSKSKSRMVYSAYGSSRYYACMYDHKQIIFIVNLPM